MGREVNHSPLSSAEVKNEWSCTSTPPICLPGVDMENFAFFHLGVQFNRNLIQQKNFGAELKVCFPMAKDI
jgi:hypothetical protein